MHFLVSQVDGRLLMFWPQCLSYNNLYKENQQGKKYVGSDSHWGEHNSFKERIKLYNFTNSLLDNIFVAKHTFSVLWINITVTANKKNVFLGSYCRCKIGKCADMQERIWEKEGSKSDVEWLVYCKTIKWLNDDNEKTGNALLVCSQLHCC